MFVTVTIDVLQLVAAFAANRFLGTVCKRLRVACRGQHHLGYTVHESGAAVCRKLSNLSPAERVSVRAVMLLHPMVSDGFLRAALRGLSGLTALHLDLSGLPWLPTGVPFLAHRSSSIYMHMSAGA